jgi:septal ring factor EnvC (AmiA/AmiB activator)
VTRPILSIRGNGLIMPRRSRLVALVAAVVAVLLRPHPATADQQAELDRTRRQLGEVEAVLRDARADAGAVAAALDVARRRLASQVRTAYMTGQVTGLAVIVQASDLRDLLERAVTLS